MGNFQVYSLVSELELSFRKDTSRFSTYPYPEISDKELSEKKNVKLDQNFLTSVLLRVSSQDRKFITPSSKCSLYRYFLTGKASWALGRNSSLLISDAEGSVFRTSIKSFYENIIKKQCPGLKFIQSLYSAKALEEVIKDVSKPFAQDLNSCTKEIKNVFQKPQTFNLCILYQQLRKSPHSISKLKGFFKKISLDNKFLLDSLCLNPKKPRDFCKEALSSSYWTKVLRGKAKAHVLTTLCENSLESIPSCVKNLEANKSYCHYPKNPLASGLSPKPDCENLSLALNFSHLNTEYPECPEQLENTALINSTRLLAHIQKSKLPYSHQSCLSFPLSLFASFNLTLGNPQAWEYELCYEDKIAQKDKCFPSIIGPLKGSPYSQEVIITKILKIKNKIPQNQTCKFIDEKDYNPHFLKFKSGCYILSNISKCQLSGCSFKVIINGKKDNLIKVRETSAFKYISYERANRNFSQLNLIREQLKLQEKEIRNLSVLIKFLEDHPKSLIQGIGCLENLLPSFFRNNGFYSCSPMPFIIDGILYKEDRKLLVTRLAIDNLHFPRLLSWGDIFSAIQIFHRIHPQKKWSLYGWY